MPPSSAPPSIQDPSLSLVLAMAQRTAALRAPGEAIVDLPLGEPDFLPPGHVIEAAREAASGPLPYALADGLRVLRDAIRSNLLRDPGPTYGGDRIAVGCCAKRVILKAFLATLNPGDEVFVNAPGNPSGAIYGVEDPGALAAVLDGHPGVRALSDDVHAHIRCACGQYVTLAAVARNLRARTLGVDGVSKPYATSGWRVGWGCGPSDLISAMTGVQAHNCTQTSTLSQHAAVAALEGPRGILLERCETHRGRRNAALVTLGSAPRIRVEVPDDAFDLPTRIKGVRDDGALALRLIYAGGAAAPGPALVMPEHLSLSFATDETTLVEGCRRLDALEEPAFGVTA